MGDPICRQRRPIPTVTVLAEVRHRLANAAVPLQVAAELGDSTLLDTAAVLTRMQSLLMALRGGHDERTDPALDVIGDPRLEQLLTGRYDRIRVDAAGIFVDVAPADLPMIFEALVADAAEAVGGHLCGDAHDAWSVHLPH